MGSGLVIFLRKSWWGLQVNFSRRKFFLEKYPVRCIFHAGFEYDTHFPKQVRLSAVNCDKHLTFIERSAKNSRLSSIVRPLSRRKTAFFSNTFLPFCKAAKVVQNRWNSVWSHVLMSEYRWNSENSDTLFCSPMSSHRKYFSSKTCLACRKLKRK